jgi:hypothetical protein
MEVVLRWYMQQPQERGEENPTRSLPDTRFRGLVRVPDTVNRYQRSAVNGDGVCGRTDGDVVEVVVRY